MQLSFQIHLEARKFSLASKDLPENLEALERQLLRPPVVATTCLSIEQYVSFFLVTGRSLTFRAIQPLICAADLRLLYCR
jgi:hypothetical protein